MSNKFDYQNDVTLVNYWGDLPDYGINGLTGEACAYGSRMLCDLSEKGVEIITNYLGGNMVITRGTNWNSMVGKDKAVASFMMPRVLFDDLRIFIMFHVEKKHYVHLFPGGALTATDTLYRELSPGVVTHVNPAFTSKAPMVDGRNVHQATGRVV